MSILSQQDIRKPMATMYDEDRDKFTRFTENLGRTQPRPETTGFGGFTYAPDGLQATLNSTHMNSYVGPRGNDIADSGGQYGPEGFARLAPIPSGGTEGNTLLGAFGEMLRDGTDWGKNNPAAKMKTTFTSGRQMNSLKISSIGVAGTPIASGGTFQGYESGDKEYGITNYNLNQVQIGADDQTTPTAPATEEIRETIPIENTGLRNIPDMA